MSRHAVNVTIKVTQIKGGFFLRPSVLLQIVAANGDVIQNVTMKENDDLMLTLPFQFIVEPHPAIIEIEEAE